MTSISTLSKNLRLLPYSEMVLLADHIYRKLGSDFTATDVAQALLEVGRAGAIINSAELELENKILRKIFSRKRQINVRVYNTGYVVEIPSMPGSVAQGRDLRELLTHSLDQIIAHQLLAGDNK